MINTLKIHKLSKQLN